MLIDLNTFLFLFGFGLLNSLGGAFIAWAISGRKPTEKCKKCPYGK